MLVEQLIKELNAVKPKQKVAKNYINPFAAQLLHQAGYEVKMQDGSVWKAEYDTNYGFAEFTRARHFQGRQAKEQVMLINDKSWFLARYQKITGDNQIIPMDFWGGIPEQLVDTQRISTTPQSNAAVVATKDNWLTMFGDEIYIHHLERQVDLPIEVIRQYLYDPDFEDRVERVFQNEIGNDLTRLAVKGTDITFTSQNFYKLLKGFAVILKEAKGVKSLPSGITRFAGPFGKFVTPVKIDAPSLRFITPLNDTCATDTSAKYVMSSGSLAHSTNKLALTSSGTSSTMQYFDIISVMPNTDYVFSVAAWYNDTAGSITLSVLDAAGNTIATGASYTLTSAKTTPTSITFNTYNNSGVRLKISWVHTTGKVYFFDDFKLDRASKKFQYFDVMNILDTMVDSYNPEYDITSETQVFLMSKEDAALIARAQRLPLYVTESGEVLPMATETREQKLEFGQTNLQHRGYSIITVPYANSLNNGGWIIFGPDTTEFRVGIQNIFSYTRQYEARMDKGGEGYKYTYHLYESFGIRNPGKFVIAEGIGSTLKCEDLVIGLDKYNCGTRYYPSGSSATAITYDLSDTSGTGGYMFCDTPGAEIYYVNTANTALQTYAAAVAGATKYAGESLNTIIANGVHTFFRAFLDGVAQPSQILDITGAT